MRSRVAWGVVVVVSATLLTACGAGSPEAQPLCTTGGYAFTPEQTRNASTIATVGKRLGVPDHAVTIALATALQESKLVNLDYGDRDSLGLFQQRPSQGWGTKAMVLDPRVSSTSFFTHLERVRGWRTLPVTEAAQAVQHSGAPDAYAQWETPSRQLASALTGEIPAGLSCQFTPTPKPNGLNDLERLADTDLGPDALTTVHPTWATAAWLIAHASSYGVSRVSMAGRTWEAKRGTWVVDARAHRLTFS